MSVVQKGLPQVIAMCYVSDHSWGYTDYTESAVGSKLSRVSEFLGRALLRFSIKYGSFSLPYLKTRLPRDVLLVVYPWERSPCVIWAIRESLLSL